MSTPEINLLVVAGFDVDVERAEHLLASGEAHGAGDAACSAVPEADWKRARETLGLGVYDPAAEDAAYDERQRAIRATEMAAEDAYEQACRERLAGEQWDREQTERRS